MIDEHAGEAVADGPLHERRGDRGVHPAGQPADGVTVADLLADRADLLLDDVEHGPGRAAAGQLEEPAQDARAVLGVHDLGMELDAEQAAARVLHGRHRGGFGARGHREAGRGLGGGVPVRHPDPLPGRRARQKHSPRRGAEGVWGEGFPPGAGGVWGGSSPRASTASPPETTHSCRIRPRRCARPCRRGRPPSAGSRSRCRGPAPRRRTGRPGRAARRRRRPTRGRRTR